MCDLAKDANGRYNEAMAATIENVVEKLIEHYEQSNQVFHSLRLKLK